MVRVGQRVYWHGVTPNPDLVGTIRVTGTLRHEVQWDGCDDTSLEWVDVVAAVSRYGKCCVYCASLLEQGRSIKDKSGESMATPNLELEDLRLLNTFVDGPKIWDAAMFVNPLIRLRDAGLIRSVDDMGYRNEITDAGKLVIVAWNAKHGPGSL
jgi:hypothetical protein